MSDWNRLYESCKDATGAEISDEYDAHLVVEELDSNLRELQKKYDNLRNGKSKKEKNFYDKSIFEVRDLLVNANPPSQYTAVLFRWVNNKKINLKQFEFLINYLN